MYVLATSTATVQLNHIDRSWNKIIEHKWLQKNYCMKLEWQQIMNIGYLHQIMFWKTNNRNNIKIEVTLKTTQLCPSQLVLHHLSMSIELLLMLVMLIVRIGVGIWIWIWTTTSITDSRRWKSCPIVVIVHLSDSKNLELLLWEMLM